jgi:hypothetical protein
MHRVFHCDVSINAEKVLCLGSPSFPFFLLKMISTVSLFYFYTNIKSTLTIFAFLHHLYLLTPIPVVSTSWKDMFYIPVFYFCKCIFIFSKAFCHSISSMNILHFNQINPLYYFPYPFLPTPYYSTDFRAFHYAIFLHRYNVFHYYEVSIILFSSPCSP